jgi:LEA14-like dessication related protein
MRTQLAVALLAVFLTSLTTTSCGTTGLGTKLKKAGLKMPAVSIKQVKVKSISLRDIELLFDVQIQNPYPIGLKLDKVSFAVDVEKKPLFKVDTPSKFEIKAKGAAITPLTLKLEYAKIISIVKDFTEKDALVCDISGVLHIPLPKLPGLPPVYEHKFKLTKKIPAIKPSISVANFKVKAPSMQEIKDMIAKALKKNLKKNLNPKKIFGALGGLLSGKKPNIDPIKIGLEDLDLPLQVNFDIKIKNDAKAKISFDRMGYDFVINGIPVFSGKTNKTQVSGDTLVISVINTLSSKKLGKGLIDVFKQRKGKFGIHGKTSINLPAQISDKPVVLDFNESGSFSL